MASDKKHEHVSVYKGLQKTSLCLAADACLIVQQYVQILFRSIVAHIRGEKNCQGSLKGRNNLSEQQIQFSGLYGSVVGENPSVLMKALTQPPLSLKPDISTLLGS